MKTVTVVLSEEERELFERPVRGSGGMQSLLRSLARTRQGYIQILSRDQSERIARYVARYGDGGFQGRLKPLAQKIGGDER